MAVRRFGIHAKPSTAPRIRKGKDPVSGQASGAEPASDCLRGCRIGGFARPRGVEDGTATIGPKVQAARAGVAARIDADRRGIARFSTGPVPGRHHILAA